MPHAALWVVQLGWLPSMTRIHSVSMPHAALWVVQRKEPRWSSCPLRVSMPHAALWVVQLVISDAPSDTAAFQCRTRLCGWCSLMKKPYDRTKDLFQCRTRLCGWCSDVEWRFADNVIEFQCRTRLFPFAPTTASRSPSPAHAGEAWLRAVFSQNHAILASPADAGERSTSANHTSFYSCSWDVFPYDLFPVQLGPMGLLLGQVSKWRVQRADGGAHAARGFVGGAAALYHDIGKGVTPFQCRTRLCGWCSPAWWEARSLYG